MMNWTIEYKIVSCVLNNFALSTLCTHNIIEASKFDVDSRLMSDSTTEAEREEHNQLKLMARFKQKPLSLLCCKKKRVKQLNPQRSRAEFHVFSWAIATVRKLVSIALHRENWEKHKTSHVDFNTFFSVLLFCFRWLFALCCREGRLTLNTAILLSIKFLIHSWDSLDFSTRDR